MQGYIKLYRKIMDSPIWGDPYYLKLWMYCLMKATHKKREVIFGNQVITLEPGQFITGRNALAEDLNKGMKPKQQLSERTWYRYLENLERWQMLTIKKTNKYSVVSILKWSEYQETDQQLSNSCPSNDQQMSTNKNVKNVKNDNNTTSTTEDAVVFYQMNFGIPGPYEQESILKWIDESDEHIVLEAMKRAIKRNKKSWGYVEKILKDWARKNITTIEQARAEEIEFQNQFSNVRPFMPKRPQTIGASYDPSKDRF